MTGGRGPRDRPPGLAPKGTIWGFAAIFLIAMLAPAGVVCLVSDTAPVSFDVLDASMLLPVPFALVWVMPLAVGLSGRRFWAVCWYFCAGAICLGLTLIAAMIGAARMMRWIGTPHSQYEGMVYMGWGALAVCVVMCWPLIRALRLHYWQPWALPETWEAGDERNARWANRMVGLPSPPRPPRRR